MKAKLFRVSAYFSCSSQSYSSLVIAFCIDEGSEEVSSMNQNLEELSEPFSDAFFL